MRHYKAKRCQSTNFSGGLYERPNFKSRAKAVTLTPIAKMKNQKPRIAASSYLNTAPLIWSFTHGSQRNSVDLFTDTAPSRCAEMLARGEVDAALVPVIEFQRIEDISIAPNVCVGSKTGVRSVVLATRKNNWRVERQGIGSCDVAKEFPVRFAALQESLWPEREVQQCRLSRRSSQ